MEIIKIDEQEIVNAVCVYMANKNGISPESVYVELLFDDDEGYSAELEVNNRKEIISEAKLVEALRNWMDLEYNMDPFSVGVQFDLHEGEGIVAYIS
ncbi:hypothetical protein AN964_10485 [Heyndrickxia shackletonii]|uniref:DUF2653 family protein n=1 Tax=Heyndrickxia shackletonii TaxID=157838 RepID=A0A0Q3WXX3_9BACI|nr:DUF2653 family protein [Heyndrickxia shackletonii]KQL53885.1 hypothetical protein AN964_10485 [Heyndrickxia shackletonii]MBB2478957.1 DUF2653 family protein [Bacillus sp. APMAM]NEY97841.1 DUF2653 family protein [Heyndrickxia shackletonii]RTZ57698.1 DUF2653 family protein [Bacillus sp. SAJ1]